MRRKIATSRYTRGGSSTGTRVSTGSYSPSRPAGGFVEPVYQGAKQAIDYYYGYNPEKYYQNRLRDPKFRYDLEHYLLGRPTHKSRKTDALPFIPRFPKKKFPKSPSQKFQKSSKYIARKLYRRSNYNSIYYRKRFPYKWSDFKYRRKRSYRMFS